MGGHCRALVVVCIDYRFRSAIRDFLVSNDLKGDYDMVSLAGATKDLVENDQHGKPLILKQIDIANRLHSVGQLYIIHHMDCGAYGGHDAFKDIEAEKQKQIDDMKTAEELVKADFPNIEIKKVLARIENKDGKDIIDFEVIN